jgi:hypothetical protein
LLYEPYDIVDFNTLDLLNIDLHHNTKQYKINFKLFFNNETIQVIGYINVRKFVTDLNYDYLPNTLKEYYEPIKICDFLISEVTFKYDDFTQIFSQVESKFAQTTNEILAIDKIEKEKIQTPLKELNKFNDNLPF